jgi:uncharacterized protein (DUF58 family)
MLTEKPESLLDARFVRELSVLRRRDAARRLAAAIGDMTLARSERAQLFVTGQGLTREHTPARGRGGLSGLLRALAESAVRRFVARSVD